MGTFTHPPLMARVTFRLNRPLDDAGKEKTEPVSILVQLYISKQIKPEIATGERVIPKHWKNSRVTSRGADYDRINDNLSRLEKQLTQLWRDNLKDLSQVRGLMPNVVRGDSTTEKKTVIEAVRKFIAQYEKEKEAGTVKRYKVLLKKLESFNPALTFEDLDVNFYDHFKNWLYENTNPVYNGYHLEPGNDRNSYVMVADRDNTHYVLRPGLFDDVVYKYIINVKTICAWAEKRGYVVHPAYKDAKSWPIIKREYLPISLTQDELHKIEALNLPETHLDIARDYLCLECRTGQRISDLRRFRKEDITGHTWTFNQKKGARTNQKTVSLPLVGYSAPALVILQKYNYELPGISEQKLNEHIKTVCKKAGIDQEIFIERWAGNKKVRIPGPKYSFISTHTGRKTFITIALQFMSPQMVMNITGIKSFQTLKHYAGESESALVEEGLRKIENDVAIMKKNVG